MNSKVLLELEHADAKMRSEISLPKREWAATTHGCSLRNIPEREVVIQGVPINKIVDALKCLFTDAQVYSAKFFRGVSRSRSKHDTLRPGTVFQAHVEVTSDMMQKYKHSFSNLPQLKYFLVIVLYKVEGHALSAICSPLSGQQTFELERTDVGIYFQSLSLPFSVRRVALFHDCSASCDIDYRGRTERHSEKLIGGGKYHARAIRLGPWIRSAVENKT